LVAVERSIVAHCRSGFETECASDILRIATRGRIEVACDTVAGSALVTACCGALDNERWQIALAANPPWFARSLFVGDGPHTLPERDRITPLLVIATQHEPPFRAIWLETPDTNEGNMRSGLCRRLSAPLTAAADHAGLLAPDDPRGLRLHVVFVDATHAWVGTSRAATGSPSPMGIPRLGLPHSAPSRSTLKLAEALLTFLTEDERLRLLKPGMRAVDLGAAPGGWTWQLAQRGLSVTAIDNGLLRSDVARDPLVEHLRADGLTWRPRRPVDWMVCDIVLQPSRIAALVAAWVADGACTRTIFNLKLPMKKRYAEVERCAALIGDVLSRHRLRHTLRFKQLYHDREEITGYLTRAE
jgi:23S rRNA (cytidine2498-2'-O)-methyltransferase